MVFAENFFGAVFVLTPPQAFGPDQPDGPAETRNVMKADAAPTMANGNNAASRAASQCLVGFNMDDQGTGGLGDSRDVNAGDAGEGTPFAVPAGSRVEHVRVSYEVGSLVATNSKRP